MLGAAGISTAHHFEFAFLRRRRRRGGFVDDMLLSIFCTSIFTESVCSCKQSLLSILSPLFLPEAGWVVIERKTVFSSPPPPNEKGGEGILSSSFPPPFKKPLSPISHSGHVRAIEAFFFPPPPFPIGAKEVCPLVPPCPAEGEKAPLDFHPPLF